MAGPRSAFTLALVVLALAAPAWQHAADAQIAPPIGPYVIDAHGTTISYPTGDNVAAPRGLTSADLPSRGLGLQLGGQAFLRRGKTVTLGVGGNLLWTRRTQSPSAGSDGTTTGTAATTRLTAFSPQVSLNFGTGLGWSYLSAGFGAAKRSVSAADAASPEPGAWAPAIDVGGGARWFITDHLGVSFDLRLYSVAAQDAGVDTAGFPRTTNFAVAAGVSIK